MSTGSAGGTGGGGGININYDPNATTKPGDPSSKNCGLQKYDLQRRPAELLTILDKSGSMRGQMWSAVTSALDKVVMRTQSGIYWGLKLYPADNQCAVADGVHVEAALDNYQAVSQMIAMNSPGGRTPTRLAVEKATAYMATRNTMNPKYLLLATDGKPNCLGGGDGNDDMGAIAAVTAAAAAGLNTFVVGLATQRSDAHLTLNEMAVAGKMPRNDPDTRYFPANNENDLASVLEMITGQIASCTFPLTSPPPSPDDVAVNADGQRIPRDTTQMNGWNYGAGNQSIVLHGDACDGLKSGKLKSVQIIFGCPGVPIE